MILYTHVEHGMGEGWKSLNILTYRFAMFEAKLALVLSSVVIESRVDRWLGHSALRPHLEGGGKEREREREREGGRERKLELSLSIIIIITGQ